MIAGDDDFGVRGECTRDDVIIVRIARDVRHGSWGDLRNQRGVVGDKRRDRCTGTRDPRCKLWIGQGMR